MVRKSGERCHCTRCSLLVETSGEAGGKNPIRARGSVMKKQYAPPVFQYLDFLRFPEPMAALHQSREELGHARAHASILLFVFIFKPWNLLEVFRRWESARIAPQKTNSSAGLPP